MSGVGHHNQRAVEPPATERVTVRISESLVERADELVRAGHYMDRSAVVRESIRVVDLTRRETGPERGVDTQRVSMRLPSGMLEDLDYYAEAGFQPHQSGAIREALRRHLLGGDDGV